jgi:hypothetical protein
VNRRDNISIILAEYMSEVLDVEIQAEWVVSIKDCDSYEDNYIAVKYVRGTHPYRSEGIKIRREALQEWMDKRTTGGSMAGFPVRRGFTQQNPKENEVNRLFTEARSTVLRTPVPPKTWATARAAYTADEVNRLQVSCRQALKTGALEINGVTCTALTCSCMYSGEALCPHRQFAYLFGWDRSYVLEQPDITLPGVAGHVAVPIALGQVMLPVEAVWEVAEGSSAGVMAPPTGWVRISGNPLTTLCREFSAFPEESAVVRLGPDRGHDQVDRGVPATDGGVRGGGAGTSRFLLSSHALQRDGGQGHCRTQVRRGDSRGLHSGQRVPAGSHRPLQPVSPDEQRFRGRPRLLRKRYAALH